MNINKISSLFTIIIAATIVSCGGGLETDQVYTTPKPTPPTTATTLKTAATFPIGNIVSANRLSGSDSNFTTLLILKYSYRG